MVNDPIELSSGGSNNLTHTSRNPISSLTMYEVFSKPMRNAEKFQFILKTYIIIFITKMIILYYYNNSQSSSSIMMKNSGYWGRVSNPGNIPSVGRLSLR